MSKRMMVFAVAATVALVACGSDSGGEGTQQGGEATGTACPPAPTALAEQPTLPPDFPIPGALTLTTEKEAGPSTILEGFWESDLSEAYSEYKDAFPAAGYEVTFSEQEEDEAEVNFAGGDTTGQVKLEVECEGRTDVRITIRPA
ncbi:MAG: hypothetical protein ABR518_02455 [Actinomycetota bacterium]